MYPDNDMKVLLEIINFVVQKHKYVLQHLHVLRPLDAFFFNFVYYSQEKKRTPTSCISSHQIKRLCLNSVENVDMACCF